MIITAWNNGGHKASGTGYGFKLNASDRNKFFNRDWKYIILELYNFPDPIIVNVNKRSFWDQCCGELIKKEIGIWLRSNRLAPWPKGDPPKLSMNHISGNRFYINLENANAPQ